MTGFLGYLLQRIVGVVLTVVFVGITIFLMVRILPGDPARVIAGVLATEQDVQRIRVELGLDEPLPVQAGIFLRDLAQGDLGVSARTSNPVLDEIGARLPATLSLATAGMLLAVAIGIPLGAWAAARAGSAADLLVSTFVLFGISLPVYWLGLMLIILFSIRLRWLPAAGAEGPLSLILPALTLAAFSVAFIARITRSSMLEVLRQDYVRTAHAKGVGRRAVEWRHALRNALPPVVTVIGLQFGELLGGAILTETVFGWPGLGRLLVDSIFARDYPMVQGLVIVFAAMFAVVNLIVDLTYERIDPRVRYA
ncbi:MAG: ABC transporter permease subunit [Deinococcus-Thermus bacterium]|jgi:ABC-type dipeptide/oligopeptide/nickel transport system permease component|nr:ABC transporter permease subunit [Deinococcota bacterium]